MEKPRTSKAGGHELLYPHQISARIHGMDDKLIGFDREERLVQAAEHGDAGATGTPQWLAELEMENQSSIAFMGKLIGGRRHRRERRHTVGVYGRAPMMYGK